MKSWREAVCRGMTKFQAHEGKMVVHLFTSHNVPALLKKARDGDEEAGALVTSLLDYVRMLELAKTDGFSASCAGCNVKLGKGEMAAFGVIMPAADHGPGVVTSFCVECALQGYESCKRRMLDSLAKETGVELSHIH